MKNFIFKPLGEILPFGAEFFFPPLFLGGKKKKGRFFFSPPFVVFFFVLFFSPFFLQGGGALALAFAGFYTYAQTDVYWVGGSSGNWNVGSNWDTGHHPTQRRMYIFLVLPLL
ncbi:MAG: hypothetical protein IPM82_30410 [Saprospiraceae bacterium]|nr:hypothetical protein [Saprospiraceae bacterium]